MVGPSASREYSRQVQILIQLPIARSTSTAPVRKQFPLSTISILQAPVQSHALLLTLARSESLEHSHQAPAPSPSPVAPSISTARVPKLLRPLTITTSRSATRELPTASR